MPTIHLNQLRKTYPGSKTAAVKGLELVVEDGEFLCLLGPSGCGKTTILRMIAGTETLSGGSITIGDRLVDSVSQGIFVPPEQRRVGLVFQSYALWPHMTVRQNVEFGLKLRKLPAAERKLRSDDVMDKLRIAQYADRYPAQLSGGQQQRVSLARMLAINPAVLLLDEPLSNLDAALRLEMRNELRRLHENFGTTIVFVSHDQWEAMTLATTIAVMSEGELQQVGTPNDIYAHPQNRFVAEFIGNPRLNMIALDNPDCLLSRYLKSHFELTCELSCCGIRPEDIQLHQDPQTDSIPMIVDSIIPTGGSWIIELAGNHQSLRYSTQTHPSWQPGESVQVTLPDSALHFFDREGRRREQPSVSSAFPFVCTSTGTSGSTDFY